MKIFDTAFVAAAVLTALSTSCLKNSEVLVSKEDVESEIARIARDEQKRAGTSAWASKDILTKLDNKDNDGVNFVGTAHFGILYFKDKPAHRAALLNWIKENGGTVEFESTEFGYFDATLKWNSVQNLIENAGRVGLTDSSIFKLEIDEISRNTNDSKFKSSDFEGELNSSLFGPVHSAGYGSKVTEFRAQAAKDLLLKPEDLEGQGTTVAVADQGIDLSRSDVFGNRIKDFQIGDFANWHDTVKASDGTFNSQINEADYGVDLNGDGLEDGTIPIKITEKDETFWAQIEAYQGAGFKDAVADFSYASSHQLPTSLNLFSGKFYSRAAVNPSPSAVGFKFRKSETGTLQIAFVGLRNGSEHGIANLHMVGGDMFNASSKVRYTGVAPQTQFMGMQIWNVNNAEGEYGQKWIPLARSMIMAAEAKSDVIDLDIYTPGTRDSNDLLNQLACRISNTTNSVIVVASHNFGPLPDTIQSLAQSPCVLGIGASHSLAALRYGRNQSSIDPIYEGQPDDTVQIASYSGRGFGMNGWLKPDIISPAYAYTVYGEHMVRFGGTSGATPATAGMIALLKQAARLSGVELNFHQVKFLLQNSSRQTDASHIRDGFGFSNLLAAWNLFRSQLDQNTNKVAPLFISHQGRLHWDGHPATQQVNVALTRAAVVGDNQEPAAMKFWIEYAEDSADTSIKWLKFRSPNTGTLEDEMSFDVPFTGETTNLPLTFNISDDTWNQLPKGRLTALVKGVRASFYDGKRVDFVKPITIFNGKNVTDDVIKAKPLYADEVEVFTVASRPGDVFWFSSQNVCVGQNVPPAGSANGADSVMFVTDNTKTPSHASAVMNGYAPLALGRIPVQVKAEKEQIHFAVARKSQLNCFGGLQPNISIRRMSIENKVTKIDWKTSNDPVALNLMLTLKNGILNSSSVNRNAIWTFKVDAPKIKVTYPIAKNESVDLTSSTSSVRLLVMKPEYFQGVFTLNNAEGLPITFQTSRNLSSDISGFGSQSREVGEQWFGLGFTQEELSQGASVSADLQSLKSKPYFEIARDLTGKLSITSKSVFNGWNTHQSVPVTVSAAISNTDKASLNEFLEKHPNATVRWEAKLKILESQDLEVPTSHSPPTEIWFDTIGFDIPQSWLK